MNIKTTSGNKGDHQSCNEIITPHLIPPSDTVSMKTQKPESESLWTKAPVANLVRYEPSGIYFARAKVHGKLIRKSLDTNVLSIAKLRLADVLDAEHKAIGATKNKIIGRMTFGDALVMFQEREKNATEIKDSTKTYNKRAAEMLLKTWSGLAEADVKRSPSRNVFIGEQSSGKNMLRRSPTAHWPFCAEASTLLLKLALATIIRRGARK